MRPRFGLSVLLLLAIHCSVAADDPFPDARKALDQFYADRLKQPFLRLPDQPEVKVAPAPWVAPLKQLASEKPEDRRPAVAYLSELLALALEDETSGKAPWRNTPYWGGGAEVPARDVRHAIADELAKAKPCAEVLPVLKWYFDNERDDRFLPPVVEALGKVDGEVADSLRAELATKPHVNAVVAAGAIRQIAARKKTLPAEQLAVLCHHHRAAVREAARALSVQQGGKDPGPFDPAKAVRGEPVAKLMDRVLKLMPELPPANAEFVTVAVRYLDGKKVVRDRDEERGWLVKKEGDTVTIYTLHGRVHSFKDKEKTKVSVGEPIPNGMRFHEVDVVTEVKVAAADPAELVKEAAGSRKKGDAGIALSERGGLTGQFRGSGATLYEAILGAWLYRTGKDADAAMVILPALDSVYRDEHLLLTVRDQVGELVGQKMLVAFVGDRDYPTAIRYAKQINELYPDTRFHGYAKGLAQQLPKRTDDFTKLKLPTPAEWAELKKKLTRDQQIDYLCERLRLLNCFQMGQPGGYDPGETQYAESCGLSENAAWGGRGGKTEVINPWVELTGEQRWRDENEGKPKPKGMELTLKDVPRLAKYLRDDHYMLIVSFGRDFAPGRTLSSTRPHFASVINDLARKDVCRVGSWENLTPAEIDKEIERIDKWAAENSGKTPEQLELAALEEDVAVGQKWFWLRSRVVRLLKAKDARVYDVMNRILEQDETDSQTRGEILGLYREYDAARAKDLATKYLADKDAYLRLSAALIVFKIGDKAKARPILGDAVGDGYGWQAAAEALLDDGRPESRKELGRLTRNGRLSEDRDGSRAKLLARCAAAGLKEPFAYYLKLLEMDGNRLPIFDSTGKEVNGISYTIPVAEVFAAEIVNEFAPDDAAIKDIAKKFPETKDQIPHLKKWLQSKLEKKD
jgi:hypothetical protein